jgi:hypothetical protein
MDNQPNEYNRAEKAPDRIKDICRCSIIVLFNKLLFRITIEKCQVIFIIKARQGFED